MRLKTAIFSISVLTFSLSPALFANFSEKGWIYHGPSGDDFFERCGGQLGSPLVSLDEIQKKYALKRSGKKDFVLETTREKNKSEIRFSIRHAKILGKDWESELSQAPVFIKKKLCVPLDFGDRALGPLLTGQKPSKWNEHLAYVSYAQVVIDPGHGGNDWGTLGVFKGEVLKEKDLALEYAKELEAALKEKNIDVALTRRQDVFVALSERAALVNKLSPKLFISLHLNSNGVSPGFEIFTLSMFKRDRKALMEISKRQSNEKENGGGILTFKSAAKQELSIAWAADFKKVLSAYLKPVNAGLRREPFYLLYAVESPGVLVELGYMDRAEDLNFLLNKSLRKTMWSQFSEAIDARLKSKSE